MYNFNLCSSFLNKLIVFVITISLLSVSFSFSFDENIKQELNTLYEATSFCEYYNTITNFSYDIINKILESANIVSTLSSSQKDNTDNKEKNSKKDYNLYLLKTANERETNNLKILNYYNFSLFYILLDRNFYFNSLLSKFFFKLHVFKLNTITTFFCYFARGNIDYIIKFNNIIINLRLV